jgi:hypothetical protein
MTKSPRFAPASAVTLARTDALLRLLSIVVTFILWYSLALAALALWAQHPHELERWFQAATAAGLAPLAAVVVTWRGVEWALARWVAHYVQTHIESD